MNFELNIYACVFAAAIVYILPDRRPVRALLSFSATLSFSAIVTAARIIKIVVVPPESPIYPLIKGLMAIAGMVWVCLSVYNILIFARQRRQCPVLPYENAPASIDLANMGYQSAVIFNAGLFAFYTAGKLMHWGEMEKFFIDSGYAFWFCHVTVIMECTMAFLLLLPLRLPVRSLAAGILLAEMFGAIITHMRNGDPFAASLDALNQVLVIGIVLFWCYQQYNRAG